MRENESEPGDRRDPPGYVSPWTRAQSDDDPEYPPPHYATTYGPGSYPPPSYPPPGYGPPGYGPPPPAASPPPPPREDTIAFGNPPGLDYDTPPAYGPPPAPRSSRTGRLLVYALVAAIAACIGAGATAVVNHHATASSTGVSSHDIPAEHDNAPGTNDLNLNAGRVESRVEPGLVDITATLKYESETAEGTGMVLSPDGLVLTNNHVIINATSVYASMVGSGRTYQARVIGYNATDDVALLQLEHASGLSTVSLGNSSQLSVGTAVLALGNAQGKGGVTPAQGIISALNRSINASDAGSGTTEDLHGMEQTTAQIQQGDSGGALADNAGQVVGMITAANTSSPQPGGTIGFAIPINTAVSIARQIAADDHTATIYIGDPGFLGVLVATSNSANPQQQARDEEKYARLAGSNSGCIQNDTETSVPPSIAPVSSGVLIINVLCGTVASTAGLRAGDVVTAVNGHPVAAPGTLGAYLDNFHPGATVTLTWTDVSGGQHTSAVALGTGPVH
jgi:S1-C subfamily serine protease